MQAVSKVASVPVPSLPEEAPLSQEDITNKLHDAPALPNFATEVKNEKELVQQYGKAISFDSISSQDLARLFFKLELHRGWDFMEASPKYESIFLPPNSNKLKQLFRNKSNESNIFTEVFKSDVSDQAIRVASGSAYVGISSPYLGASSKVSFNSEDQSLSKGSNVRVVKKFVLPIADITMKKSTQIKVDKGDTGFITLHPLFLNKVNELFGSVDWDNVGLQEIRDKFNSLYNIFGECYPSELAIGCACYGSYNRQVDSEVSYKKFKENLAVAASIPLSAASGDGSAQGARQSISQKVQNIDKEVSNWQYLGVASVNAAEPGDLLPHRLDSNSWAIIDVRKWGFVYDLLPQAILEKLKQVRSRLPEFLWRFDLNYENNMYMFENAFSSDTWLSYWHHYYCPEVIKVELRRMGSCIGNEFHSKKNEEWPDLVGLTRCKQLAYNFSSFYPFLHFEDVSTKYASWSIETRPEWKQKVAIKNSRNGQYLASNGSTEVKWQNTPEVFLIQVAAKNPNAVQIVNNGKYYLKVKNNEKYESQEWGPHHTREENNGAFDPNNKIIRIFNGAYYGEDRAATLHKLEFAEMEAENPSTFWYIRPRNGDDSFFVKK